MVLAIEWEAGEAKLKQAYGTTEAEIEVQGYLTQDLRTRDPRKKKGKYKEVSLKFYL